MFNTTDPNHQSTTSGKPDHPDGLTIHFEGHVTVEFETSTSRGPGPQARRSRSIEDEVFSGLLAQLPRVSEQYNGIPSYQVLDATTEILRTLIEEGKLPNSLDDRFIAKLIALIESSDERTGADTPYLRTMAATLRAMLLDEPANGDDEDEDEDEATDADEATDEDDSDV